MWGFWTFSYAFRHAAGLSTGKWTKGMCRILGSGCSLQSRLMHPDCPFTVEEEPVWLKWSSQSRRPLSEPQEQKHSCTFCSAAGDRSWWAPMQHVRVSKGKAGETKARLTDHVSDPPKPHALINAVRGRSFRSACLLEMRTIDNQSSLSGCPTATCYPRHILCV